jgi:hypothetical protein
MKGQLASAIPFIIGFTCFPGTHCCVCEDVALLSGCRELASVLPGAASHHMGFRGGFHLWATSTELCGCFSCPACRVCLSLKCVERCIAHIRGGVLVVTRQCEGARIVCVCLLYPLVTHSARGGGVVCPEAELGSCQRVASSPDLLWHLLHWTRFAVAPSWSFCCLVHQIMELGCCMIQPWYICCIGSFLLCLRAIIHLGTKVWVWCD